MELTRVVIDGYVEGATCCLTFLFPSICSIFLLRFLMVGKKRQKFERDKIMQSDCAKWCNTCQRLSYYFTFFGRALIKHISIENILMISF